MPADLLASYPVAAGEALGTPTLADVDDPDLRGLRDDLAAHRDAWELWTSIATDPWEDLVLVYVVATDGRDGDLASVAAEDDAGVVWSLHVDPADLADRAELEHTLVHELAHLVSLGPGQLERSPAGFTDLDEAGGACGRALGVEEGCLEEGSYLTAFIRRFWPADLREEADRISAIGDPDAADAAAAELYDADPDRFANDYAASHPVEDFAESWATFVLYEYDPADPAAWVRKAEFFADYPELVDLRATIWDALRIAG